MLRPVKSLFVFGLFIFVFILSGPAAAQIDNRDLTYDTPQRLEASEPGYYARFGWAVDIDGDTMVVGNNAGGSSTPEEVHIYIRSGSIWVLQATITANDAGFNDHFGSAVALSGNTAIIGAFTASNPGAASGAAYVFVRNGTTWTQQAKLTGDSGGVGVAYFGEAVDLDGNTAIVGQRGLGVGAAFIFVRNGTTWTQQAKFTPPETGVPHYFGGTVALSGNTAIVGTVDGDPYFGPEIPEKGIAYVYVRSGTTWTQQARLMASDGQRHNHFSYAIALDGDTALISAPMASDRGKVYAFIRQGNIWVEQFILRPTTTNITSNFGIDIALDGNTAVIGDPNDDSFNGAAYVYSRSGGNWIQQTKLVKPNGEDFDYIGWSLGISGNTVIAGAMGESSWPYPASGAAYVFTLVGTPDADLELLVNGGFDGEMSNGVPEKWERKNTTKDERRCNKPDEALITYSGSCAYFMKGGETGGKLAQNVNLSRFNLKAGDVVRLNGFYNKQSTGSVYVYLYVNYANFPEDQRRIILTQPTNGYQPVNQSTITLKEAPTRIRVVLENQTTSGKTWFDGMNLMATTGSQNNLLSLPLPLDEQLQTEGLIPLP